jgi:hypothetical protein
LPPNNGFGAAGADAPGTPKNDACCAILALASAEGSPKGVADFVVGLHVSAGKAARIELPSSFLAVDEPVVNMNPVGLLPKDGEGDGLNEKVGAGDFLMGPASSSPSWSCSETFSSLLSAADSDGCSETAVCFLSLGGANEPPNNPPLPIAENGGGAAPLNNDVGGLALEVGNADDPKGTPKLLVALNFGGEGGRFGIFLSASARAADTAAEDDAVVEDLFASDG